MRFSLYINQVKALEWGLNLQQASLFSYLYELPSWAKCVVVDGNAYWWSGKDKIIDELPILTDKPDTIKRHMAALEKAGLIERITYQNHPLMRVTEKGKAWNCSEESREKNPDMDGKNIPTRSGKKSPQGREKSPAYKNTKDPNTKIKDKKLNKKDSIEDSTLSLEELPESLNHTCWAEWLEYRRKVIKKPFKTKRGEQAAITKLLNLSGGDPNVQQRIIDQSIDHEWQGLFELKSSPQAAASVINDIPQYSPDMDVSQFEAPEGFRREN